MRATTLTCLSLLLAASCAAGSNFLSPEEAEESSVYGAFLAARYAGASRDMDRSAALYAEALELQPDFELLSQRSFFAALLAGDFELADQAALSSAEGTEDPQLVRLYLDAVALERGDRYEDSPDDPQLGAFARAVQTVMTDWSRAQTRSGAREVAAETLDVSAQVADYGILHKAMLFEAAGQWDRALDGYTSAALNGDMIELATILQGALLERRGRRNEAIALYRQRVAEDPYPDPEVLYALERAEAGRRAPRLDANEYAARALYALTRALTRNSPGDYTALFQRLVERVDPEFARNRYSLAQTLESIDMDGEALAIYESLGGTAFETRAKVDAAWLLFTTGRREEALLRAEQLQSDRMDETARLLLADIYRLTDQCERALPIYASVVEADRSARQRWQPAFFEGICYQQLGDWDNAEARYIQALEYAPDEPRVLNHLGYNWIVFGEHVEEGLDMVRRAAELAPDNGAILDSVGWGLYKLGRYEEAVGYLERAAVASPGNATINWHLGDAYARQGRMLEARFSWEHALELGPEPRERALIEARLEGGIETGPDDIE